MQIYLTATTQNNYMKIGKVVIPDNVRNEQKSKENQTQKANNLNVSATKKSNSLLESLLAQKQNVIDMKNKLISKSVEKGMDIDLLRDQLKAYDEDIVNIEAQIADAMLKETQKEMEKAKEKKVEEQKLNAIEETLEEKGFQTVDAELSSGISAAAANLEISGAVKKVYTQAKGEQRVAESYADDSLVGSDAIKTASVASSKMDKAMGMVAKYNKNAINAMEKADEITQAKEDYKDKNGIVDKKAAIYKETETNTKPVENQDEETEIEA